MGLFGRKPEPVAGCAEKYGFPDPHRIAGLLLREVGLSEPDVAIARRDYYAGQDNVYHYALNSAVTHIWSHSQMNNRPVDTSISPGPERGDYRHLMDRWCYPWVEEFGASEPEMIRMLAGKICPGGRAFGRPVEAEFWPDAVELWRGVLEEHPGLIPARTSPRSNDLAPLEESSGPVETALFAFRSGQREAGVALIEQTCSASPSNTGALALAAYELHCRGGSEHEFGQGTGYLERLERLAPHSRALNSLKAINSLTSDLLSSQAHLENAHAGEPGPSPAVDLMLYTLADIAASEAMHQILVTPAGEQLRIAPTRRMRGVILLLEKRPAEALAEFRAGVDEAIETATALPDGIFSPADHRKYVANLRRDCRSGQWLALLDLGREEEAANIQADGQALYQAEYGG